MKTDQSIIKTIGVEKGKGHGVKGVVSTRKIKNHIKKHAKPFMDLKELYKLIIQYYKAGDYFGEPKVYKMIHEGSGQSRYYYNANAINNAIQKTVQHLYGIPFFQTDRYF